MAPAMLGRSIDLGLTLDLELVLRHQPPGDHRRARMAAAGAAVAERLVNGLGRHFVAHGAAMAATLRHLPISLCSSYLHARRIGSKPEAELAPAPAVPYLFRRESSR